MIYLLFVDFRLRDVTFSLRHLHIVKRSGQDPSFYLSLEVLKNEPKQVPYAFLLLFSPFSNTFNRNQGDEIQRRKYKLATSPDRREVSCQFAPDGDGKAEEPKKVWNICALGLDRVCDYGA